jgi:hypothetical protein
MTFVENDPWRRLDPAPRFTIAHENASLPPRTVRQYLTVERRDENGILDLAGLVDLGKAKPQLTVTVTFAPAFKSLRT